MTIDECIKYFGNIRKAALKIGLTHNASEYWIKSGRIPLINQIKIEKLTKGELKADEDIPPSKVPSKYRSVSLKESKENLSQFMMRLTNLSKKYGVIVKDGTILYWKEILHNKDEFTYDFVKVPVEDAKANKLCNIARLGRFDIKEQE